MGDYDQDQPGENVDVEPAGETLEGDDPRADPLDTGIVAGERYAGSLKFGTTADEQLRGESLDQLLSEEEPEDTDDGEWTDEDRPPDDGETSRPRSGRLVAGDEGIGPDEDKDLVAFDVGIDGGAASAEEAAVHITDDPPFD